MARWHASYGPSGPGGPGRPGKTERRWSRPAGKGADHLAFRYTALASTSLVGRLTALRGSRPVILPSVCSAITRLISVRAASGAVAKSAVANMAAASFSRAVNSARSGRPDWTHTVFGARSVTDLGPSPRQADTRPSPLATTSGPSSRPPRPSRCRTRASSVAVRPRAPHRAISSALATLAGEKTVLAASWASNWYMSAANAAAAAAAARAPVSAADSSCTVPSYPPPQRETTAG